MSIKHKNKTRQNQQIMNLRKITNIENSSTKPTKAKSTKQTSKTSTTINTQYLQAKANLKANNKPKFNKTPKNLLNKKIHKRQN